MTQSCFWNKKSWNDIINATKTTSSGLWTKTFPFRYFRYGLARRSALSKESPAWRHKLAHAGCANLERIMYIPLKLVNLYIYIYNHPEVDRRCDFQGSSRFTVSLMFFFIISFPMFYLLQDDYTMYIIFQLSLDLLTRWVGWWSRWWWFMTLLYFHILPWRTKKIERCFQEVSSSYLILSILVFLNIPFLVQPNSSTRV